MTPEEQQQVDRIERDRRRREALLLLLLLGFSGRALQHARAAVRVGADPVEAAGDVITGNAALSLRGLQPALLPLLTETYVAGIRRALAIVGVVLDVPDDAGPTPDVAAAASELARRTADAVRRIAAVALQKARADGLGTSQILTALGEAWRAAGMHADNPFALEAAAERAIVGGFGGAMWSTWNDPDVRVRSGILGFVHRSILDNRTSNICIDRDALRLPWWHSYWLRGISPLHWRCRSVQLPVLDRHDWSTELPTVPVEAGFGYAPAFLYGLPVGRRPAA